MHVRHCTLQGLRNCLRETWAEAGYADRNARRRWHTFVLRVRRCQASMHTTACAGCDADCIQVLTNYGRARQILVPARRLAIGRGTCPRQRLHYARRRLRFRWCIVRKDRPLTVETPYEVSECDSSRYTVYSILTWNSAVSRTRQAHAILFIFECMRWT